MPNRAEILKPKYQDSLGLPLAQVLSDRTVKQVLDDQNGKYRQVLYTLILVLWAWISQVTGAVLDVAMAPFDTSEWQLSR